MPCRRSECGTSGCMICLLQGENRVAEAQVRTASTVVVVRQLDCRAVNARSQRSQQCSTRCPAPLPTPPPSPNVRDVDAQDFALAQLLAVRHRPASREPSAEAQVRGEVAIPAVQLRPASSIRWGLPAQHQGSINSPDGAESALTPKQIMGVEHGCSPSASPSAG